MQKLIQKYNSFVGVANKLAEYIDAIYSLPPRGEGAKEQTTNEVKALFKQLNGQSKSLENSIIDAIKGR